MTDEPVVEKKVEKKVEKAKGVRVKFWRCSLLDVDGVPTVCGEPASIDEQTLAGYTEGRDYERAS